MKVKLTVGLTAVQLRSGQLITLSSIWLRIAIGCSVLAFTTACGSPKNQAADAPSQRPIEDGRLPRSDFGDRRSAECNQITANDLGLEGRITTFYEPQTQRFIENYKRLTLSAIPDEVFATDFHYLQIFPWRWTESEGRKFADKPASFLLQERNTGRILTDRLTVISRNSIRSVISDNGLGFDGITLENFFDHYILIFTGMEFHFRGFWIGFFDSTASDRAIDGVHTLLPPFEAHPIHYEDRVAIPGLVALHPFLEFKNAGWTSEQFGRYAMNMCMAVHSF